jgi:hypothetical protein
MIRSKSIIQINSFDRISPLYNLIPMKNRLIQLIKKQWFMILLTAIFILNIGDPAGTIPAAGTFLREKLGTPRSFSSSSARGFFWTLTGYGRE